MLEEWIKVRVWVIRVSVFSRHEVGGVTIVFEYETEKWAREFNNQKDEEREFLNYFSFFLFLSLKNFVSSSDVRPILPLLCTSES